MNIEFQEEKVKLDSEGNHHSPSAFYVLITQEFHF